MNKSLLLTNYEMQQFAGSEIDTATMANFFVKLGYDVTDFTLYVGYPIEEELFPNNIKVITLGNVNELKKEYDIIWAHHYPLLDYLLFYHKINAKKIIYASLSSFIGMEAAPEYWKDLSVILSNSEKTKESLIRDGVCGDDIIIFPNYAPKAYFETKLVSNPILRKLCIISNHVPKELRELVLILKQNEIEVDIIGIGDIPKRVDDKLLLEYDAIISVGKTVNYAIALGIPVYCYDQFGGPGFINKENYRQAFQFHFSGKTFDRFLTGKELYEDIVHQYTNTLNDLDDLRKMAYADFCYEDIMSKILIKLSECKTVDVDKLRNEFPWMYRMSQTPIFFADKFVTCREELKNSESIIKALTEKNNHIKNKFNQLNKQLKNIHSSKGYQLLNVFYTLQAKIRFRRYKKTNNQ